MKKSILITGATGFVGMQVLKSLKNEDVLITLVVRTTSNKTFDDYPNIVKVITTLDLFSEDASWWANQLKGIDTIIHLAWFVEPRKYLYSSKNMECCLGTLIMGKAAVKAGVKKFVGIGTCFEYDLSGGGRLSVKTPLDPLTPYAAAKAALFVFMSQWLNSHNVDFAWCRLFYLYGEGEDKRRLVPYLRKKLILGQQVKLTSGKQIRDFIDVSDAGEMIVKVALSAAKGPQNICSTVPISVRQMAENIADEYGRRDLLKFDMRPDNEFDPPYVVGVRD